MDIQIYSRDNVYCIIKGEDNDTKEHTIVNHSLPVSNDQFNRNSDSEIDVNSIADPIEAFKCKYCDFISVNKTLILAHCEENHVEKVMALYFVEIIVLKSCISEVSNFFSVQIIYVSCYDETRSQICVWNMFKTSIIFTRLSTPYDS